MQAQVNEAVAMLDLPALGIAASDFSSGSSDLS